MKGDDTSLIWRDHKPVKKDYKIINKAIFLPLNQSKSSDQISQNKHYSNFFYPFYKTDQISLDVKEILHNFFLFERSRL